jgi:hypothetical protein
VFGRGKFGLIPIEDRKRELIAARHIAREKRLYGTSEIPKPEPDVLPVFLSSDEVIGLIAYGCTRALDGPVPGAPKPNFLVSKTINH